MEKHTDTKNIKEALDLLNSYAKDKRDELQNMIGSDYDNLKSAVGSVGAHLKADASEIYNTGKEKIVHLTKNADENVHKYAWAYIAGAALGAVTLGYLLGRTDQKFMK